MMCNQQHCRHVVHALLADQQDDVADVVVGIDEALTLNNRQQQQQPYRNKIVRLGKG
jgi:hypothetical protein